MKLSLAAFACSVVLFSSSALACIWDTDTLAQEMRGGGDDPVRALVGAFPRNPSVYYEVRARLALKALKDNPNNWEAYDNAAVAYDRLGNPSEAIQLMEHKVSEMDRAGYRSAEAANHRYRYLANQGTFHAHRWLKEGGDFNALGDLRKAEKFINDAIVENPEAHFGREKVQLGIIKWLLTTPSYQPREERTYEIDAPLPSFVAEPNWGFEIPTHRDTSDEIRGISGLITMGAAWRSFDVVYGLHSALISDGRHQIAIASLRRLREITEAGGGSLVIGAPEGKELFGLAPRGLAKEVEPVIRELESFRAQADAWQRRRLEYLAPRLARGEHPDIDPDFWDGFKGDPLFIELKSTTKREQQERQDEVAAPIGVRPPSVSPGARGCSLNQGPKPGKSLAWFTFFPAALLFVTLRMRNPLRAEQ